MASVRDHMSHHDDPEELSLLTESATVTDVTYLDEDRTDEVQRAVASTLDDLDREEFVVDGDGHRIDWDGIDAFLDEAGHGPLAERLSHLVGRYYRAYPSLLTLDIEEGETPMDFVSGQYVTIRFHDTPRPYSVASSPNRDHLEFCMRRVPGGRLTSDVFADLEQGDEVVIRGPNGDFVKEDPSTRDLAFLATGTGVAPFKSMIDYVFEEGRDVHGGRTRDVWLFLGSSWKDDLPYREEFRDLAEEHENFHFVPSLSREGYLTEWEGESDYVQQTFVKYLDDDVEPDASDQLAGFLDAEPATDVDARIDPENLEVYACGVSAMVSMLVDAVTQVGVPEQHVHGEGYG